jgi:hypothetical protein
MKNEERKIFLNEKRRMESEEWKVKNVFKRRTKSDK